jgi:Na+-driven multidrug efflux pump
LISSIIVSALPSGDTAVYFVAMILLNYTFSFGDGLQSPIASITGQCFGAGKNREIRSFARYGRTIGLALALGLSAVYVLASRWFMGLYFSDGASVSAGVQYSYVVASLSVLQILRMVNIAAMRGIGEVRIPRVMATICVMMINPAAAFLLAEVCRLGIWGIWAASLITQAAWYLMSAVEANKCIKNLQTIQAEGL